MRVVTFKNFYENQGNLISKLESVDVKRGWGLFMNGGASQGSLVVVKKE